MTRRPTIKRCPCTIICHGASEVIIARFIKQAYKLPINIVSKQNGAQNIELTSIQEFMSRGYFSSLNKYKSTLGNIDINKHKIFILLDLDGHDEEAKLFLDKTMFKNHWAKELIEPILSVPDLDEAVFKNDRNFNKKVHKPAQYQKLLLNNKFNFKELFNSFDKKFTNIYKIIEYLENFK